VKHPPEEHPGRRAHAGGVAALTASVKHTPEEHPAPRRSLAEGAAAVENHPPEELPAEERTPE